MNPTRPPTDPPFDPNDTECPFAAAIAEGAPKFTHENPSLPLSAAALIANRSVLQHLQLCTATMDDDVIARSEEIGIACGVTAGRAEAMIDQYLTLTALPRLAFVLEYRAHLRVEHLRTISNAITPILQAGRDPELDINVAETLRELEPKILAAVLPRKDGARMPTTYVLNARLQKVIEDVEPLLRPKDEGGKPESRSRVDFSDDGHETGFISAVLDRDEAARVRMTVEAIMAKEGCTESEAFVKMADGNCNVDVTLNLYCHLNGGPIWSPEVGWLEGLVAQKWLRMVSTVRILADYEVPKYRPADGQKAQVIVRDGVCMFPGCDVPAHKCQLDHIQPYDHECPEEGGPTDTMNLHLLCQRHHNLKTDGLFEVIRFSDGEEIWTSTTTGQESRSRSQGPAAGPGRVSVSARLRRRTRRLREANEGAAGREGPEATETDATDRDVVDDPPPWEQGPPQPEPESPSAEADDRLREEPSQGGGRREATAGSDDGEIPDLD